MQMCYFVGYFLGSLASWILVSLACFLFCFLFLLFHVYLSIFLQWKEWFLIFASKFGRSNIWIAPPSIEDQYDLRCECG